MSWLAEQGVVHRVNEREVTLVIEDYPEAQHRVGHFTLTRLANAVVYTRYAAALRTLEERGLYGSDSTRILQVLYGEATPSHAQPPPPIHLSPSGRLQQRLNSEQQTAVSAALSSNDVFVVHGPPGTGQSSTTTHSTISSGSLEPTAHSISPSPSAGVRRQDDDAGGVGGAERGAR